MKATELHNEIKENLKDYPIEYLRNKVTDKKITSHQATCQI